MSQFIIIHYHHLQHHHHQQHPHSHLHHLYHHFQENELPSPPLPYSHLYSNLISTESGILSLYCKCHQEDFDQIFTFYDDNRLSAVVEEIHQVGGV